MNNCLITELSSIVNNGELVKLNTFRFIVKKVAGVSDTDRTALSLMFSNPGGTTKLKVIKGNGHISTTEAGLVSNPQTEIIINGSDYADIYFENEDFEVEVENKDKLNLLDSRSGYKPSIIGADFDLFRFVSAPVAASVCGPNWAGSIGGLKDSEMIYINSTGISGDIECFSGKSIGSARASILTIANSPVYGDITAFKDTVADGIDISGTQVYGTVEELATLLALTHSSGTFTVDARNTNVTYQGQVPASILTITFSNGSYVIS